MIETVNDVIPVGVNCSVYPYSVSAINFLDIETGEDNIVHFDIEADDSTDVVPLNNKYFKIIYYDNGLVRIVSKFLKIQDGKIINIVLDLDYDDIIYDIFSTKYDDTFLVIGYDLFGREYNIYKIFVYPDGSFKKELFWDQYLCEYLFPDPTAQTFSEREWSDEQGYLCSGFVAYCADKDILYVSNTNYIRAVSGIVDNNPSLLYKRKINRLSRIERTYATGDLYLRQKITSLDSVVILTPDGEPLFSRYSDRRFLLLGNNKFVLNKGSVYSIKERKIVSKYFDFLIHNEMVSYGGSISEYNSYITGEWDNTPSYKLVTTRYSTDYVITIEHDEAGSDIVSIYDFRFDKLTEKSFLLPKNKYIEERPIRENDCYSYNAYVIINFFTKRWGLCLIRQSDYGYINSIINTKGEIILINGETAIDKPCFLVDNDYSDIAFVIFGYSNEKSSMAFFNYKGEMLYIIDNLFQKVQEYRKDGILLYDWSEGLPSYFSEYDFNIFKGDNLFIRIINKKNKPDRKSLRVLYDLKENKIKRIIDE